MALLETPEAAQEFKAPPFTLSDPGGTVYTLDHIRGKNGTLVVFICNHCPYVRAVIDRMVTDVKVLQEEEGIGAIAIMPNDFETHPDDRPEKMEEFAQRHGLTFPYVVDETQQVAKAYGAVCTPDIFGFDSGDTLRYRGRVDSAGPKEEAPEDTQREMLEAMKKIAREGRGPEKQHPSMGCSIKWRAGE